MRVLLLAALALSLSMTAVALPAQAVGGCLPLAIPTHACANVEPCSTEHARGLCAGARVDRVSAFASCVQREGEGSSCFVNAGGREHRVRAHGGCARDPGVSCGAVAFADDRHVVSTGFHVSRGLVCPPGAWSFFFQDHPLGVGLPCQRIPG